MEAKRSDRVVIDELLAFVQQKLDVMDELSLEQICTSSYSEEDILAAKKVLADNALTTVRLGTRQKDGRDKKDLQDIFRVFKQTDPDDVPTFVVRDIHKLPPVTFDHVDVTRLLKDITLMKAEIVELRSKFENSEKNVVILKNEVTELLLNNKKAAPTVSPTSAQNVTVRRRAVNASISKSATPIRDPVSPQAVNCAHEPLKPVAGPSSGKTYAQVSRDSRLPRQPNHASHPSKVDKDGFTLVEKKKRQPRPARNHRGTAPAAATTTTLRAAEPMMAIYLSRFEQNTSGEDIIQYIKERCCGRIQELSHVILSRLESTRMSNFKSFVLRLPAKYKDTFLAPEFWPVGIVFRRYRETTQKLSPTK